MKARVANPKEADPQSGPPSSPPVPEEPGQGEQFLDQLGSDRDEFSSEDIDQFLKIQDPDFAGRMDEMKSDDSLTMAEIEVDVETAALHDEIERWKSGSLVRRKLVAVFPGIPRLVRSLNKLTFRFHVLSNAVLVHIRNFGFFLATEGRRKIVRNAKRAGRTVSLSIQANLRDFRALSLRLKLALGGLLAMAAAAVLLIRLAWSGDLLPGEKPLFETDLAAEATQVYEVGPEEGFENYYDNVRSAPNMLLLPKLVVNVRASENSGANPMAAIELFVEGLNPDVVIEVKDREVFFRDLIQRATEEFSFDTLATPEGKASYLQSVLKEMNRHLTRGELRNARIKTIVLKP